MSSGILVFCETDGGKLKKVSTVQPVGQAALQLETHD